MLAKQGGSKVLPLPDFRSLPGLSLVRIVVRFLLWGKGTLNALLRLVDIYFIASIRRSISSGETSSTCVAIVH